MEVNIASLSVIIFLGVICNVFAITFVRHHKRSEVTMKDKIIIVLCIANLIQTFGFFIELYSALNREITDVACKAAAFSVCASTYSAIGCFVALMFERYTSIVYPFKYVVVFSKRFNKYLMLTFPVIVGVLLGSAPLFGWGGYGRARQNSTYCGFDFEDKSVNHKSYFYATIIFSFALPLICTFICFGNIISNLRSTASSLKRKFGKGSTISRDTSKAVHHQYVSSLLTATIYVVSWVPYAVVCYMFFQDYHVAVWLEYFAIHMSKSAVVTSPVIFCLIERRVVAFVRTQSTRASVVTLQRMMSFRGPKKEKQEKKDVIFRRYSR